MSFLEVRVWGDFACFTRPEMKVERVSYDVMTPSAARGVLEAIFWKPEFHWNVREIWVLNEIQHVSLLRNEINSIQTRRRANKMFDDEDPTQYFADDDRTQRHTLALRDVDYIIKAEVELADHAQDEHPAKYRDQFRRRVKRGQCFHRPYLGCREFSAHFAEPKGDEEPISRTDALGRMLYDMDYERNEDGDVKFFDHDSDGRTAVKGSIKPRFFRAQLEEGILHVPEDR